MTRLARLSVPWVIAAAAGVAVVVNLVAFAIGRVAGATFEFTSNSELRTVDAVTVAGFSSAPLALGLAVTAAVARSRIGFVRVARWLAVVLCVVTIAVLTVPADFDTASTIALSVCHLTLIPINVVVLAEIERRPADAAAATTEAVRS